MKGQLTWNTKDNMKNEKMKMNKKDINNTLIIW